MKIFDSLLGLLPSWVPFAAVGVLAIGLAGGFFVLKASWQAEGAANVIAADQKAVIEQQQKDAKEQSPEPQPGIRSGASPTAARPGAPRTLQLQQMPAFAPQQRNP